MKKQKIVIITSRFPFPLDKGDKLRIYHQIKYMSKYHNIYLIALNTEGKITKHSFQQLAQYCKEIHVIHLSLIVRTINIFRSILTYEPLQVGYFYSKNAHRKVEAIIHEIKPDWCYGQLIRTAKYIYNYENNIIDYMDAFSKGIERRIKNFPKYIQPIIKYESKIVQDFEKKVFNHFKKHSIITYNDRRYIQHPNANKITIIPNGVDTHYFAPRHNVAKKYDIVFVGNMNYPPNIEAARYICEEIAPIIKRKYKKCKVLIGGTNPNKKIKKMSNKDVKISGWVEDIRTIYASGKIFVAPMFIGTGLQNKLLEAMAMGIPCITTELANNALRANSSQIIIANNNTEFANACIDILKNNDKANSLRENGLKFIKENYDWNLINHKLTSMFK